jgi:hypothetical protein
MFDDSWWFIFSLLIFPLAIYYIKQIDPCDILGHDFQNNGNVDICKRCGLIKRKVRKK